MSAYYVTVFGRMSTKHPKPMDSCLRRNDGEEEILH
jgi:hypothetical protein